MSCNMESEMLLRNAKNEVQRKIGRNMLLFQKMEFFLKFFIANGKASGYSSDFISSQEKRAVGINKKTLGMLVGDYIENTFSQNDEIQEEPKELTEPYLQFGFRLGVDENFYETKKKALAELVADRNELIHNFLSRINLNSVKSCLDAGLFLDQQREKILPEINLLKSMIKSLQELKKEMASYLDSEKGQKQFVSIHCNGPIPFILGEISVQSSRPDGWTLLSLAGQKLWEQAPEEITNALKCNGYKTLKRLIMENELFELKEEPMDKGGVRVLYRLKVG
jgi:hypothetical protein